MNKKLLAAAVAGALAMPGIALAQSSVTISGFFKVGFEDLNIGNPSAARAGMNTSETRMVDNSSRIIFTATEDLGGGLAAVGQFDFRPIMTNGGGSTASGNDFVGLKSNSWGQVTFGQWDLHYMDTADTILLKGGALEAWNVSLMSYAGGGGVGIANDTRTPNVIKYDSPNWNGFAFTAAYSTNAVGTTRQAADLLATPATTTRKGDGYTFAPTYTANNWQVGYSYWNAKPDAPEAIISQATAAVSADQRSDRLWGYYLWNGFRVGLSWDRSRLTDPSGKISGDISNRNAWSIPLSYETGPHTFYVTYTKAQDDSSWNTVTGGTDSSAKMIAVAYNYDLSKLTSVGVTYAKINNGANANYNLFTSVPLGGDAGSVVHDGEDPRIIQLTMRKAF